MKLVFDHYFSKRSTHFSFVAINLLQDYIIMILASREKAIKEKIIVITPLIIEGAHEKRRGTKVSTLVTVGDGPG